MARIENHQRRRRNQANFNEFLGGTVAQAISGVFLWSCLLEVLDSAWVWHRATVSQPKNALVFYLRTLLVPLEEAGTVYQFDKCWLLVVCGGWVFCGGTDRSDA
jgi:hypothetical protein